ncbi:MAG: ABC transporter permease [Cyclobacteriaceae bacterium]
MFNEISRLIARQFWSSTFRSGIVYPILGLWFLMVAYAAYSGWESYTTHNHIRSHYQQETRASWENNPDKHQHRMAHNGSFAFRLKHPLSMFDFGLESFTGNAVFLEAHKQNSVNFSEASFSTGLLRFGEISLAMLLQVILPLIIFFLGFSAVAAEREQETLRMILSQGISWKEVLVGKSLGLAALALLFFLPVILVTLVLLLFSEGGVLTTTDGWLRFIGIFISYALFLVITSVVTVLISAASKSSKGALVKLLAVWLFLIVLLPRTTQALGGYVYPAPSRVEFEADTEEELIQIGDSHNPDDPHFNALRDSVLSVYQVSSVEQLPFNYSGFVMREGERISAEIYNRHIQPLHRTYQQQNRFTQLTALINPYLAIKTVSMALSGTDFTAYRDFQQQAEAYRYQLAQTMNELQMELISNRAPAPGEGPYAISRAYWSEFPDFEYEWPALRWPAPSGIATRGGSWSWIVLFIWGMTSVGMLTYTAKRVKVF